jgi:sensor histidine kinase YesM
MRAPGEGLGLANTREWLRQLYQNDFHLELTNVAEGGAVVTLEIPFATDADGQGRSRRDQTG